MKNTIRKLTTSIIVAIIAMMMVNPVFAEEFNAICVEVPSEENSPEYAVIYNPDTGEEAKIPADSAFYESGEDDDFVDLGEEMDEAAISIGLPTREEIAQNASGQIGNWQMIDLQVEEAIDANPNASIEDQREIANDIIYNAVGDDYCPQ